MAATMSRCQATGAQALAATQHQLLMQPPLLQLPPVLLLEQVRSYWLQSAMHFYHALQAIGPIPLHWEHDGNGPQMLLLTDKMTLLCGPAAVSVQLCSMCPKNLAESSKDWLASGK